MTPPEGHEVYGLHVTGVAGTGLLPLSAERRPRMAISHGRDAHEPPCVGTEHAVVDLPEGRQVLLARRRGTATFTGPSLCPDELVHPYLGAAASIFCRWADREVFHAGAFVAGGLAWAVVGPREAGKSTLLAAVAARGMTVLADDLVVTDGYRAFCGPRTIDLRRPLPGATAAMTRARQASRWRLCLPTVPAAVPLGGWIYLRWGGEIAMPAVRASVLLGRLASRRSWSGLPSDPETLLALAALPGWDLGRPAEWARMDEAVDLMIETILPAARSHESSRIPQGSSRISTSPAPAHPSRNRSTSPRAASAASPNELTSTPASSSTVLQTAS